MGEQPVQVQSGVALGCKIALGFMLASFIVAGGTCVACGACTAVSTVSAAQAKSEELERNQRDLAEYSTNLTFTEPKAENDGLGTPYVSTEVTNQGKRTVVVLAVRVEALDQKGRVIWETSTSVVRADSFVQDVAAPLKPGFTRKIEVDFSKAPKTWARKAQVHVEQLELAP